MSQVDLTVITVCFNAERTINFALSSVIKACTHAPAVQFECLVVDGLSSDNTLGKVWSAFTTLPDNLTISVISERDMGIFDAMNKGVLKAKGSKICFLNADDHLLDNAFSSVEKHLLEPGLLFLHSDVLWSFSFSKDKIVRLRRGHAELKKLNFGMSVNHPSCIVSRKIFSEVGLFDTSYRYVGDWEWALRCRRHGVKFSYIPIPRVVFAMEGVSGQYIPKRFEEIRLVLANLRSAREISYLAYIWALTRLTLSQIFCLLSKKLSFFQGLKARVNSIRNENPPRGTFSH